MPYSCFKRIVEEADQLIGAIELCEVFGTFVVHDGQRRDVRESRTSRDVSR